MVVLAFGYVEIIVNSKVHSDLPLFSIVMPVFNCAAWVGEAIRSVQCQSIKAWELIVVDDGSTDESLKIVQSFANSDPRILAFSMKHSGTASIPRNDGLRKVRGKYVAFLDADDIYHPERLEHVVYVFDRYADVSVVINNLARFSESPQKPIGRTVFEDVLRVWPKGIYWGTDSASPWIAGEEVFRLCILYSLPAHTSSISIRKEDLYAEEQWFDPSMKIGEDRELWLRLIHGKKTAFLPNVLACYRKREGSLTNENSIRCSKSDVALNARVRDRYASELSPAEYDVLVKKHAGALFNLGWNLWRAGCPDEARKCYRESFEMDKSWAALKAIAKTYAPKFLTKNALNMPPP
jgi:glycosyltransferase involved in cell wall biosynthesis